AARPSELTSASRTNERAHRTIAQLTWSNIGSNRQSQRGNAAVRLAKPPGRFASCRRCYGSGHEGLRWRRVLAPSWYRKIVPRRTRWLGNGANCGSSQGFYRQGADWLAAVLKDRGMHHRRYAPPPTPNLSRIK